jgi:hypothetical protein
MRSAGRSWSARPAGGLPGIDGGTPGRGSPGPEAILAGAARTLDLAKPVAVLLFQVLHFIPDADDPYGLVARIMAAVAPGSYLVIVHATSDVGTEVGSEIQTRYNQMMGPQVRMRSHDEVTRFFDGLELLGEGVTSGRGWTAAHDGTRHAETSGMAAQIRLGAGAAAVARTRTA